jgi:hypothetical protein
VVADDPDDRGGRLKDLGGSQSDRWNNVLANQAMQALWVKNSSPDACQIARAASLRFIASASGSSGTRL